MTQHVEIPLDALYRYTREHYDRLVEAGAFDEDDHVELLRGMIVHMSPSGTHHAWVIGTLSRRLFAALEDRAEVHVQLPFAASGDSEPEPDISVVPLADYREAHPDRALLIIEVCESSLRRDRRIKLPIYAESRVPEVWFVNLANDVVEIYRDPLGSDYGSKSTAKRGDTVTIGAFPDVHIAVADILP